MLIPHAKPRHSAPSNQENEKDETSYLELVVYWHIFLIHMPVPPFWLRHEIDFYIQPTDRLGSWLHPQCSTPWALCISSIGGSLVTAFFTFGNGSKYLEWPLLGPFPAKLEGKKKQPQMTLLYYSYSCDSTKDSVWPCTKLHQTLFPEPHLTNRGIVRVIYVHVTF